MPLIFEYLFFLLLTFAIGLVIGWVIWGRDSQEY